MYRIDRKVFKINTSRNLQESYQSEMVIIASWEQVGNATFNKGKKWRYTVQYNTLSEIYTFVLIRLLHTATQI